MINRVGEGSHILIILNSVTTSKHKDVLLQRRLIGSMQISKDFDVDEMQCIGLSIDCLIITLSHRKYVLYCVLGCIVRAYI